MEKMMDKGEGWKHGCLKASCTYSQPLVLFGDRFWLVCRLPVEDTELPVENTELPVEGTELPLSLF